jgi:bacterioferritin
MDKPKLIAKLNEAVALELGGLLQYHQYSQVLMGEARRVWQEFFEDSAEESYKHAKKFASKVVSLGGTPTVEPEPVRQTTDIVEMLQFSLDHERKAVQVYTEALAFCEDNAGYRNLLEDQIEQEQDDCEEIEKYLNQVKKTAAEHHGKRQSRTA